MVPTINLKPLKGGIIMDKRDAALMNFKKQYNCCQCVFAALAEDVGFDRDTALKIAACFGGGMKCGEACGAVTGVLMAIGYKYGDTTENDIFAKQLAYNKSLEFIDKFRDKNGSILCRDLLGYDMRNPEEMLKVMQKGLHISVCSRLITDAVDISTEIL